MRDKQRQKLKQRESYLRNKEAIAQRQKERRPEIKLNSVAKRRALSVWLNEIKAKVGICALCKRSFPSCLLDFHHVRGIKISSVRHMVSSLYSKQKIEEEVAKCDLVCIICHRLEHVDGLVEWTDLYRSQAIMGR